MNRGLVLKAIYEMWPPTLLCGLLLLVVEAAVAYVIPTFQGQLSESLMQVEFLQNFLSAMLGVKLADRIGPAAFMTFPWVHPVVLSLVWAHSLFCCTHTPSGEIDRGTADVTMTLPVTRFGILISETAVWLVCGAVVLLAMLAGNEIGTRYADPVDRPTLQDASIILVNLFCLYLAVGSLAWLVSAASDRRGVAITIVFVLLLASYLLNFLAQFWEPAESVSFLGVLYYYRPLFVLRDGTIPWRDTGILLGVAAVLWVAAGIVFTRRDVCTT